MYSALKSTLRKSVVVLSIQSSILLTAAGPAFAQRESLDIVGGSSRNVDQWMIYTDSENSLYHHLAVE